jgi:hypothetical protein
MWEASREAISRARASTSSGFPAGGRILQAKLQYPLENSQAHSDDPTYGTAQHHTDPPLFQSSSQFNPQQREVDRIVE